MYECKRIAVIQRGKSGKLFPAEICEGESARSCEARVFPPRAPPFWARFFGAYVVVCVRFWWGDGFDSIEDARLSRWMRADGKAARVAGLFPVFWVEECL